MPAPTLAGVRRPPPRWGTRRRGGSSWAAALALVGAVALACDPPATLEDDGGSIALDAARPSDGGDPVPDEDAGPTTTDGGSPIPDAGPSMPDAGSCAAAFRPMLAHDLSDGALGDDYFGWHRSVVDDAHALSGDRSMRVRLRPGDEPLPACSGGHFFAGRSALPAPVPPGRTVWYRAYHYIPSTFSFGYKYGGSGDRDAASACGQHADGNRWAKWMVLAPDVGTARVYLMPTATRRALRPSDPHVRIISEALHRAGDFAVDFPRDRWFALQIAVRVSDADDGFIRAWIDDRYLGEVQGRTAVEGASITRWGIGDYWNGVPWSDGAEGRTDFWVDDIIVASDADGYDAPTGVDDGGRPYIPPCMRVADLVE